MFFSTYRSAVRAKRDAEADRDFWKARAIRLEQKLEDRTDFFIEREGLLVDRFLTAKVKTFAITDEARNRTKEPEDAEKHALDAYLADKKDFLVDCAREAGHPDPEDTAARTFEQHRAEYVLEFQQNRIN